MIVCGIALTLTGTTQLGSAFTPSPEPKPGGPFVVTGIYSRVRHPLYGGILLIVWGITLPLLSLLPTFGAIGVTLFFYLKSIYEESRLKLRFSEYESYAQRTPRFLPRIFSLSSKLSSDK